MAPNPSARRMISPNLLDTLLILLLSGALVLLIFWIVFQVLNLGDRFGTLPPWVEALVGKTWSWVTAAGGGALLYWFRKRTRPGVPTPNYLRWILGVSGGLLATVMVVTIFVLFVVPHPSPSPNSPGLGMINFYFKILDIGATNLATDIVAIRTTRPILDGPRRTPVQKHDSYGDEYSERIILPQPGETFVASVRRSVIDSARQSPSASSELCFQRVSSDEKISSATIYFNCEEGKDCSIIKDKGNPSWVRPCPPGPGSWLRWPSMISLAWAQPAKSSRPIFWVVPSLESLQKNTQSDGSGYTKFSVQSNKLPQADADVVRYEVSVNQTAVRIDGFSPDELLLPYDPKKGIHIDFGLQNLDFRGADGGHDTVGLKIDLLKGRESVRRYDLKLCYVALRSSPQQVLEQPDRTRFEWKADYLKAKSAREYEVFIHSTKDPKDAEARRSRLTKQGWVYTDGRPVHGVTRPPLGDNPNYAVAVGLQQPSGQIRFTYDKPAAQELLQWMKTQRTNSNLVSKDSYLYPLGAPDKTDRPCQIQK